MRRALFIAALATLVSQGARADVLSTVNWARQQGCAGAASRVALVSNPRLQQAASRLAAGSGLEHALKATGYTASQSAALHFSGATGDSQIARALTGSYCHTLTNPLLREIGFEHRGHDLWMVLAAPVAAPAAADATAVSQQILALVNGAREVGRHCGAKYFGPAPPLTLSEPLTRAALGHSRDMAKSGVFDHQGQDGSSPAVRVERAGFGPHRLVGENIAAGLMSTSDVMSGWLKSPMHCENIMDERFKQMGIAYAASPNTDAGMYWTQDFATPR